MNIVGVKHNLQNIELKEIDEFETIVDTLLGQILDEHDKENSKDVTNSNNNNNQMEASAISYPPMQQNSQINNKNLPANFRFPGRSMFFSHSNVTINYNWEINCSQ